MVDCELSNLFCYVLLKLYSLFIFPCVDVARCWWCFIRNHRSPSIHSNSGPVTDVWLFVRGRSGFTITPMIDVIVARFSLLFSSYPSSDNVFGSVSLFDLDLPCQWLQIKLTDHSYVSAVVRNVFSILLLLLPILFQISYKNN